MFQKEVGDRLLAAPATRDYGILSVLVQNWYTVTRVAKVAPGCFHPPPKVESVVLRFEPRPQPLAPVADEAAFRSLVKAVFAQRRKTLQKRPARRRLRGRCDRPGSRALALAPICPRRNADHRPDGRVGGNPWLIRFDPP